MKKVNGMINDNNDQLKIKILNLRNDIFDFILDKCKKESISTQIAFNAVLNVLADIVNMDCQGDINHIRDQADKIKSAIIDYGVYNEIPEEEKEIK